MKRKLFNQNYKRIIGLLTLLFLYTLNLSGQELIQLQQRETRTLRGDMAIIGNSILGISVPF